VTHFKILGPLKYLEQLELETSNFVHSYAMASIRFGMTNYPQNGRGYGHVTHFITLSPLKYLWNG